MTAKKVDKLWCFVGSWFPHLPIIRPENGSVRHRMKQRPIRFVAAAIVVLIKEFFLHGHWNSLLWKQSGCWGQIWRIGLRNPVNPFIEVVQASPAYPDPIVFDDNWSDSCYEATSAVEIRSRSILVSLNFLDSQLTGSLVYWQKNTTPKTGILEKKKNLFKEVGLDSIERQIQKKKNYKQTKNKIFK